MTMSHGTPKVIRLRTWKNTEKQALPAGIPFLKEVSEGLTVNLSLSTVLGSSRQTERGLECEAK
jgi:hypothetical protein